MNILTGIVLLILLLYCIIGIKQGLIDGIRHIISYVLGIIVLFVIAKGIGNFAQKSYINVLLALILLAAIRVIDHLLKLLIDSVALVSKLPILNSVNHLTGIAVGLFRGLCLIWILFLAVGYFDLEIASEWINAQVESSVFLQIVYYSNLIAKILLYAIQL